MTAILVLDASRTIRETLAIVLGHEYAVSTAASVEEVDASTAPALAIIGLSSSREEETRVLALLASWPATPVLFLHTPDEIERSALLEFDRLLAFLPKPFDGYALRGRVREVLAPRRRPASPADDRSYVLDHPFLSREAARIVRQGCDVDVPLLFVGERGTGAWRVAQAIHARRQPAGPFLSVTAREVRSADVALLMEPERGGLFLDAVHELPRSAQHAVVARMHARAPHARLFASTPQPLDDAVARGDLLLELAYPLGLLPVAMPPLRERTDDLAALVGVLSDRIVARLGLAPVVFSEAALDRLRHYLWFGNVTELETVLTRTIVVHRSRVIGGDDLVFLSEHAAGSAVLAVPARPRDRRPAASADAAGHSAPRLEVLLGELAHELRNPMVTIKTFSQHLDSVLADPEARARFTSLTHDAVTRMDTLLEHLLEFARFRRPARAPTDLEPLVDQVLAEHCDRLAHKGIRVERNGGVPGVVDVDAAQVLFALRSLLGGLVRELVPHEPLKMTIPEAGAIELEAHAEPTTATRLSALVDGADTETDEVPSLSFALAASLLERNGGSLHVRSGAQGATVIRITLTPATS